MNRFVKRSMDITSRERLCLRQQTLLRWSTFNDSASQIHVTVRQIFSDGPANTGQTPGIASAVSPFSRSGCQALLRGTDESRASISSDSIFPILTPRTWFVNPLLQLNFRQKRTAAQAAVRIFITAPHGSTTGQDSGEAGVPAFSACW